MKILVQRSNDRDVIGIANALTDKHEVNLWNSDDEDISEYDNINLYIFSDTSKTGFSTFKPVKRTKVLFLKCNAPDFFKGDGVTISSLPYCADVKRYPPSYYNKDFACDILYVNLDGKDRSEYFNQLYLNNRELKFWIIGHPYNLANYIGGYSSQYELTKMCVSAGVCIDFGLTYGVDLAKIGCNVITDTENTINIPTFTKENFMDVLLREFDKEKPILNPYDKLIMPYSGFLKHMFKVLEMEEN